MRIGHRFDSVDRSGGAPASDAHEQTSIGSYANVRWSKTDTTRGLHEDLRGEFIGRSLFGRKIARRVDRKHSSEGPVQDKDCPLVFRCECIMLIDGNACGRTSPEASQCRRHRDSVVIVLPSRAAPACIRTRS